MSLDIINPPGGGGSGSGVTTVATIDTASPSNNGAVISSTDLYLQSASATKPGLVNTTTQTLAGDKTFSGAITASNLSGTNTGNVSLSAVGAVPNGNGASLSGQALTLQIADDVNPGLLSASTQSIGGNKTFTGSISAANLSGTNTGNVTIDTAIGSSPTPGGASITSQVLTLQPADNANGGVLSNTTQSIKGAKTFGDGIVGNLTGNASGSAGSFTGSLVGDVTGTQGATAISSATVTAKLLTGLSAAFGAITSSDSILTAFNKLVSSFAANNIARFGDGSGGNVTVSSPVTLTNDMYYNNLTLSSGAAINTASYRIFIAGTFDITAAPAGAIFNNGSVGGNGGAAGAAGAAGGTVLGATIGGGTQGAAGGAGTTGAGAQGTVSTNPVAAQGGSGGTSGAGGFGLAGTNAGGGTRTGGTSSNSISFKRFETSMLRGIGFLVGGAPGGAAGSGGGDGVVAGGGGGGGATGGGGIWISANTITRGGSTTAACIQARGATGGSGGQPASGTGPGGGGGAGGSGGGYIQLFYGSLTGSTATNALDASGGAGGSGGNAQGTGNGGGGGASGAGGRITIVNLGAGTATETTGSGSVAGSGNSGPTGGAGASLNTFQVSL